MPSENIKKPQTVCYEVQVQSVEVPAGKFVSQECVLQSIKAGQRVGLSLSPSDSAQESGIHVMNTFCMHDGVLTVQFTNIASQSVSLKAGTYTAHVEQGE